MKIIIVNRHPQENLGGSELQCDHVARGLLERGHDIVYLAPATNHPIYTDDSYKITPTKPRADDIIREIMREKPHVVYWRFNKYCFLKVSKALYKSGVPIVFAISSQEDTRLFLFRTKIKNGLLNFLRGIKQSVFAMYNHLGFRYVAGITSMNPDFLGKLPVKKQAFVPDIVDEEVVPFEWPRPFIVWVANIKPQKQPEVFVKVAETLKNKDIDFLMVGKIQSELYHWILDEPKKNPNFYYLGPKTPLEVNGILQKSLMLIHTCTPEGFGNNFIQAWFQRKPTVSYAFDPAGFITKHQLGGYAAGNWDLFLKQILGLLENPASRSECGDRGYDFAKKNFDATSSINSIEELISSVAK
ncbi:MAG TPA: glycosyltransferase family 4 protein [Micavibrio sp.]|nr:glycosyltransferase family 4 protein [Micavibrio sp.]